MDILLLLVRLLLASVFVIAGMAKLADPRGTRDAVVAFGVPAGLSLPVGLALPLAEFAVGAALMVRDWTVAGALGALGLLLTFCVAIGWNLARGRTPACYCFGQFHSSAIGWATLARNGVLAAAVGFVLWLGRDDPGASAIAWIGDLSVTERLGLVGGCVLGAALAVQGWLIAQILGQNGRLLTRLEVLEAILTPGKAAVESQAFLPALRPASTTIGLPIGAIAPPFDLPDLDGSRHTLGALCARAKPVVLVFSDPSCGPCTALLPEISRWQQNHADEITLVVISRGSPDANRQRAAKHGIAPLLIQQDREVASAYQALGTPSAVIVSLDGTIGSHVAAGSGAIAALVSRAAIMPMPRSNPIPSVANGRNGNTHDRVIAGTRDVGQQVPKIILPDLDGHLVDLASVTGDDTLILFWNPQCGFCRRMLPDLQALEAQLPLGSPSIVVVSSGSAEENRSLGLRSTIVLDEGFRAGRAFGASGTPSAVRIDARGRISSPLAVGAAAIWSLARRTSAGVAPSVAD